MRKNIFIVPFLFLLSVLSCTREQRDYGGEEAPVAVQGEVVFKLASSNAMVTKSQYQESDLKAIRNVWVMAVADDGFWRAKYYTESDFSREGASVTCPAMNFKVGSSVTFYIAANMGDLTAAATPGGVADPSGIEYMIPASVDFSASGMPMAAAPVTRTIAASTSVSMLLEPLLARLNITINKNGITDNTAADVLASGAIKVKNTNRRLSPFGVSVATGVGDLFSIDIDKETFASSVSYNMTHSGVLLYVPENAVGNLLSAGHTQWDKANVAIEDKELATYIEYTGHKNAADDGIGGDVSYRAYLGENETNNYSVNRNTTYNCTLGLTWNGLFYTGDWRVDNSDITDGRILTLSDTPHTTSSSFTNWGRLRRNVASQLYVNFSRDGGASWVHSAKDIDGWPYGWDLYIDGVKQASGGSATAAGDLGWSYVGDPSRDQLFITPGPSAVASSVHTLQVKSADGRVVSNEVSFQVSEPLTLAWDTVSPKYVAQRGRLHPTNLEDPSAEVVYTIISGDTKVRLNSASDAQSTMVGLLAPGTATVRGECAATGQSGDFEVTVTSPVLRGAPTWLTRLYANPDGSPAHSETDGLQGLMPEARYYSVTSVRLNREDLSTTALAVNNTLAGDLYDELLALTPSVTGVLLGASSDGLNVKVYADKLTSGATSYPDNAVVDLGTLTVTAKSAAAGVGSLSTTIYSVKPFTNYDTYRSGSVNVTTNKDVHDFSVWGDRDVSSLLASYGDGIPNTTYYVSVPDVTCTSGREGAEVVAGPIFDGSYSSGTKRFTWASVIKDTNRRENDTAGIFSIKAYVRNVHSDERLYSPVFYRGRLFRHGGVIAYGYNQSLTQQTSKGVSCKYVGSKSYYTSSGLGCAFPNVGSHRTNHEYRINWRKTSGTYVSPNIGYGRVTRNASVHIVTGIKYDNTGDGMLFAVEDLCGSGTLGEWMEVSARYETGVLGFTCHGTSSGVIHVDSFDSAGGSPEMYFLPKDGSDKYEKIKVASVSLAFLKPTDGSETHNYPGISGCGFFVLHIVNEYANNWF